MWRGTQPPQKQLNTSSGGSCRRRRRAALHVALRLGGPTSALTHGALPQALSAGIHWPRRQKNLEARWPRRQQKLPAHKTPLTRGSMRRILPPSAGITSSRPLVLAPLLLPRRVNTPSAYLGSGGLQASVDGGAWMWGPCRQARRLLDCGTPSAARWNCRGASEQSGSKEDQVAQAGRGASAQRGMSKALNCWAATGQGARSQYVILWSLWQPYFLQRTNGRWSPSDFDCGLARLMATQAPTAVGAEQPRAAKPPRPTRQQSNAPAW